MKRFAFALAGALTLAAASNAMAAGYELRAGKVGAKDPAQAIAVANFYHSLLGVSEIERRTRPEDKQWLEIIMGFGATPAEAKAAGGVHLTIVTTPGMATNDPVPHLVLNVPDNAAIVAQTVALGGKVDRPSRPSTSGSNAFIFDPAGNRIELVTPRAK